MFDISWQELFIVAAIVIIVIGPKDLPRALRSVAGWVRKARGLAREFQVGLDEMMREADLDDVKKQIESVRNYDIGGDIKKELDPTGEFSEDLSMKDIERELEDAGRAQPRPSKVEESKTIAKAPPAEQPAEGELGAASDETKKTAGKAGG